MGVDRKDAASRFALGADELGFSIAPGELEALPGTPSAPGIIGQPRALQALRMGIRIRAKGYNVFVTGLPGTGRRTAVLKILEEGPATALRDIACVCNFRKPLSPRILYFPRGGARAFRKDMHELVERVKHILGTQLNSEGVKDQETSEVVEIERAENRLIADFEARLAAEGLAIVQQGEGEEKSMDIAPLIEGKAGSFDALQEMVAAGTLEGAEWDRRRELYYKRIDEMKALFDGIRRSRGELEEKLVNLRSEAVRPLIQQELAQLAARHADGAIRAWIADLEADMLGHLALFAPQERRGRKAPPVLARYGVNILVDASDQEKPPVVFEDQPTHANLFGTLEMGAEPPADPRGLFLKLRGGALLQASGGYLILRVEDLVQDEESWSYIKRVLQSGRLSIQPQTGPMQGGAPAIKTEPIEVDAKVILLGSEMAYDLLYQNDPDVQKLFKVHAEFDSAMVRAPESSSQYLGFIDFIAKDEGLLPPDASGKAAVLEFGVRLAENRGRLSTRFSMVADLLREADYLARERGLAAIGGPEVRGALDLRAFLHNLPEEKLAEMVSAGEIILDLRGKAVGRVNGLAVHDRGYFAFGVPVVISGEVAPGETGVLNVENEAGLSGEIYDKAMLIVEGFLRSRFARDFPLSMTASICFEQSYVGVDGDSASAAILYALLSAISGVPLRQDLAVTGSMSQGGQIQPVGGVTEKVEGFYAVCKRLGLTGTQGVIVPRRNLANLTLSAEVQEAVRAGSFTVYAIDRADEGLEILSGLPAGTKGPDGAFPADSVNGIVLGELRRFAETKRDYAG